MSQEILDGPRSERAKLFWRYVSKHNRQNRGPTTIKNEKGEPVKAESVKEHLTKVGCQSLMATPTQLERPPPIRCRSTGIKTDETEVGRIISQLSSRTASGDDHISANILKNLKEEGTAWITELLNLILDGEEPLPIDWRDGRVSMLEKTNSQKGVLESYRPITISTVLYRIFTKIIANRISTWIEADGAVGEMQNGFRRGRQGEDNLFILTSAIEIARKQKKRGGDVVLMGHSYEEMSVLLAITTEIGDEKRLQFNPDKSAVVIFNNLRFGLPRELNIQKKPIDFQDQYKYLGITLCDAPIYLLLHLALSRQQQKFPGGLLSPLL